MRRRAERAADPMEVLFQLAATGNHHAENAIRAWSNSDPMAAAAQRRVDKVCELLDAAIDRDRLSDSLDEYPGCSHTFLVVDRMLTARKSRFSQFRSPSAAVYGNVSTGRYSPTVVKHRRGTFQETNDGEIIQVRTAR
jgi:hypothetical protein